jgi:hypothetical protein
LVIKTPGSGLDPELKLLDPDPYLMNYGSSTLFLRKRMTTAKAARIAMKTGKRSYRQSMRRARERSR